MLLAPRNLGLVFSEGFKITKEHAIIMPFGGDMSFPDRVNQDCLNIGKVVAYTVYNLGIGIIVGLIRTIIAVAYVAKHAFYAKAYEKVYNKDKNARNDQLAQSQTERDQKVQKAEQETKKATGVKKVKAKAAEFANKAEQAVGGAIEEIAYSVDQGAKEMAHDVLQNMEKTKQEAWYGELFRGVTELLLVGAPYHTYQDNFSKDHKVSIFGFEELQKLIQDEHDSDKIMQTVSGKRYNPLF
jgi:hypothetical protein